MGEGRGAADVVQSAGQVEGREDLAAFGFGLEDAAVWQAALGQQSVVACGKCADSRLSAFRTPRLYPANGHR